MPRIVGAEGGPDVAFNPLVWTYVVDPDTVVAAPDQTGSVAAPFSTIQAAFDVLLSLGFTQATILLCPSTVIAAAGPLVIPGENLVGFNLAIVGESGSARSTEDQVASSGYAATVAMGAITVEPGSNNIGINIQNVRTGAINALSEDEDPSDGSLALTGCNVELVNAQLFRVLVQGSTVGDLRGSRIEAYASTPTALVPALWEAPKVVLDESTWAAIVENGSTTSVIPNIVGRCARETVSVVVPLLAAGELGYVDVSTAGLLPVFLGDVVIVAPTVDLAAAGADGGFCAGARVSGVDTVRVSFVGDLAGGATDFLIARV